MMLADRRNCGFLLQEVSARYEKRLRAALSRVPLTVVQCVVLIALEANTDVHQSLLAALTGLDPATIMRVLNQLQAQTLIQRRLDSKNGRSKQVRLSSEGRLGVQRIWQSVEIVHGEILDGIDREQLAAFLMVLHRIHGRVHSLVC
jgi:MarR family transcriptional regulator for hemolysin